MRQVGTLDSEKQAQRFAAWLVTQDIEAHAEDAGERWAVWVREEDQLTAAKTAFEDFSANPEQAKYQGAERTAQTLLRQSQSKRKESQSNVVEMRRRWGNPGGVGGAGPRRSPFTLLLIVASILTAITTSQDTMREFQSRAEANRPPGAAYRALAFVDPVREHDVTAPANNWMNILRGEVWRLITPIFIHFGIAHIVFNMMCLHSFGGQIEDRRGTRFFIALVVALAVASNIGQAVEQTLRFESGAFGGMSGVCYGLFGYLLVKTKFDNRAGFYLAPSTTFIALLWFVLCIAREVPPFDAMLASSMPRIANSAHAVGLALGAAIAAVPLVVRRAA